MSDYAIAAGILRCACRISGLTPEQIRMKETTYAVRVGMACMVAIRKRTAWSLPRIAAFCGRADHTSALHALERHDAFMRSNEGYAALMGRLMDAPAAPAGRQAVADMVRAAL